MIVGMSGATGAIYGKRLIEVLKENGVRIHLVISEMARRTIELEMDISPSEIERLGDFVYSNDDLDARISSGSFRTEGMVVAPCSVKSASAIASSYNHNLLVRAADVTLKEKRKLVLVVRETPLHLGHLRILTSLAELGAVILPPMPAFYFRPRNIEDIVNHTVGKVLDQFGIEADLFRRWDGPPEVPSRKPQDTLPTHSLVGD